MPVGNATQHTTLLLFPQAFLSCFCWLAVPWAPSGSCHKHIPPQWLTREFLPRWSTILNSPLPKVFYMCHYYFPPCLANHAQPSLLLTENDAPTGHRIHLGGFFRGRTTFFGAVCWGSCKGGRGCPVPNGSRFPNDNESFNNKTGGKSGCVW